MRGSNKLSLVGRNKRRCGVIEKHCKTCAYSNEDWRKGDSGHCGKCLGSGAKLAGYKPSSAVHKQDKKAG